MAKTVRISKAIKRGVALLDRHDQNWSIRIDLYTLSMGSCYECVLGQLYGDFAAGCRALKIPRVWRDCTYWGFDKLVRMNEPLCKDRWFDLTKQWREAIIVERIKHANKQNS